MLSENNIRVQVTFTRDESKVLDDIAKAMGMSKSGLIHHCTMSSVMNAIRLEELYTNSEHYEPGVLEYETKRILDGQINTVKKWTRRKA